MLYLILLVYLVVAYIFPVAGWAALICMIAPVWMSAYRGRYWCGHFCPRGNFYDRVIARVSLNRPIPRVLRSIPFRALMVLLIFAMFGVQMYFAWGDWGAMGRVFWTIILVTTIVGIVLGVLFAPRSWCSFCPMGSLSALVAPRRAKRSFSTVRVGSSCVACKRCARECPMQLVPYEAKETELGLLHPDCIKCGRCVTSCPRKAMEMKRTMCD